MALYRDRADGLLELDTDAGPLPVPASEDELRAAGHVRDHVGSLFDPSRGALAQNMSGAGGASSMGAGGASSGPSPSRLDASTNWGQGGRPAQQIDQDIVSGAAGDPSVQKLSPNTEVVSNLTHETKPLRGQPGYEDPDAKKRKGPKEERIAIPAGVARGGGGGKAGFVPVGRTTKQGVEGLEDSLDRANLQRIEQYRGEREALPKQQERLRKQSATLHAQATEEELALEEERARRARVNADLESRQKAIDDERQAIESLKIPPRDLLRDKGDLASALAIMLVIGGAVGQAYKGGDNLAEKALRDIEDREIERLKEERASRKENLRGKENELDRLEKLYGTPEAAEAEFRLRLRTVLQKQAEADAAAAGADDALSNLHARWAAKNEEFELEKLKLRGQLGDQVQLQERMSFGGGGAGGGAGKPKKIGEAVRKSVAELDAALAGLDDLEAADNRHGKPTLLRTGGGFGASDAAQELAGIGNAIGPGIARATEGDAATKDSMDRAIGSLVGHSSEQRQRARDAYRRQLLTKRSAILAAQGDIGDAPTGGGVPGEEPE